MTTVLISYDTIGVSYAALRIDERHAYTHLFSS